jgi:serine protease Do
MTRALTCLIVTCALLAACVTAPPPVLLPNSRLAEAVKARSFKSYREVLLVPPRADPRGLGPRLKTEIESLGYQVRLMDPTRSLEPSQGTAFVVGAEGWMLTCAHVLGNEKVGTLTLNGQRLLADVVKSDARVDLALLKLREPLPAGAAVLPFRAATKPAAMGEDVFTIGYPLSRMLGNTARMSRGLLSATAGLRDNPQEVQVSAEIHPGNSGGPLLDKDGQVIGVVNRIINPSAVQRATGGALPQNINFAIKGPVVLDFLRAADARAFAALSFDRPAGMDTAGRAIAKVLAGVVAPDSERRDKLVVVLGSVTRNIAGAAPQPGFGLLAADHETQEPIFTIMLPTGEAGSIGDAQFDALVAWFKAAIGAR